MKKLEQGFTLIELMFASTIFSVILLLLAFGVLQIGRIYYKGITSRDTQQAGRSIIDQVSQAIQFSGSTITGTHTTAFNTSDYFCAGDKEYSYILGQQLTDDPSPGPGQIHHVMVQSQGCGSGLIMNTLPQTLVGTPVPKELLSPHMRLMKMSVQDEDITKHLLYNITVRVLYGDDDLIVSPTGISPASSDPNAICRSGAAGTQFCAVSELHTTVEKRI